MGMGMGIATVWYGMDSVIDNIGMGMGMGMDSVIDNIEGNVSEEVVVSEIIEDTLTEYLAFKCKMCDFAPR